MSTPIPDKDKTPLMLLEERVRRLEFVINKEFRGYDLLIQSPPRESLATSDPQEPYVLDTKPR